VNPTIGPIARSMRFLCNVCMMVVVVQLVVLLALLTRAGLGVWLACWGGMCALVAAVVLALNWRQRRARARAARLNLKF